MNKFYFNHKMAGFTLLEIMVALAVFAILATITSSAMYYAFNTKARVTEHANRLNELQLALNLIERDTEQIVKRSVRSGETLVIPAFVGKPEFVELTRGGINNPFAREKRSTLSRIALLCQQDQLIRRSWNSLDTTKRSLFKDKVLLHHLNKCQFAYLDQNLQVLSEWRPAVRQNQHKSAMPKAIQLNLGLKDWDKMSLLFIIPEGLYG